MVTIVLTFIILVYSSLDKSENCFLKDHQFSKPWYVHTSELKHFKRSVILQLNYLVNVTKTLEVMPHEYSWSNLKFFRANTKAQQFSDNVDRLDSLLASDWLIVIFSVLSLVEIDKSLISDVTSQYSWST